MIFCDPGWENVQEGSRHCQVWMKKPISSYTRFGKNFIQFHYVGQPKTCCLCHSASHFANACNTIIWFNCEKPGHLASNCPIPVACNICKATNHLARKCSFLMDHVTEILPQNEPDNTPQIRLPSNNVLGALRGFGWFKYCMFSEKIEWWDSVDLPESWSERKICLFQCFERKWGPGRKSKMSATHQPLFKCLMHRTSYTRQL